MEKISQKALNEKVRAKFMALVKESLEQLNEEVLIVNSNEFAIPTVDEQNNETFITIKFSVPTGSRDGEAYDGYNEADCYKTKCEQKAIKEKEKAEAKAKKIERDKAKREALKKSKEEHEKTE